MHFFEIFVLKKGRKKVIFELFCLRREKYKDIKVHIPPFPKYMCSVDPRAVDVCGGCYIVCVYFNACDRYVVYVINCVCVEDAYVRWVCTCGGCVRTFMCVVAV